MAMTMSTAVVVHRSRTTPACLGRALRPAPGMMDAGLGSGIEAGAVRSADCPLFVHIVAVELLHNDGLLSPSATGRAPSWYARNIGHTTGTHASCGGGAQSNRY
jgi:hypothetical protein